MDTHDASDGLPPFLRFLSAFPDPADVARAMVRGPLEPLGGLCGLIMIARDDVDLLLVSSHGFSEAGISRYRTIPLGVDIPTSVSVREDRVIVTPMGSLFESFAALAFDKNLWDGLTERVGTGCIVSIPIAVSGSAIGGYAFICPDSTHFDADSYALLDGLACALGLWLSHPRSRTHDVAGARDVVHDERLELTERQLEVLRLVAAGRSNPAIAAALGFSASTVKQELHRILRTLRAASRQEAVDRAREIGLLT